MQVIIRTSWLVVLTIMWLLLCAFLLQTSWTCTTRSAPVSWTDPSKVWRSTSARTALPLASSTRRPSRPNARTRPPKRLPRGQVSGRRHCWCACSFWSHGGAGSVLLTWPRRHYTPIRHSSVPTLPAALTNPFSSSSLIIWTLPWQSTSQVNRMWGILPDCCCSVTGWVVAFQQEAQVCCPSVFWASSFTVDRKLRRSSKSVFKRKHFFLFQNKI